MLAEEIAEARLRTDDDGEPEIKTRNRHSNLGLTKETHPKLANRLPREKGALILPPGDGLTPFERARKLLGDRVQDKRQFYTLDGRPSNTEAILFAAFAEANKILVGRAHCKVGTTETTLDGKPCPIGEIMRAALEFLWAVEIVGSSCAKHAGQWHLNGKAVPQPKIVSAAYKIVKDEQKFKRSRLAEVKNLDFD